jgi:hypothetical protein
MINIPVQYAYLALSLAAMAVWLALFLLNKDDRRRQLVLSAVFCVAGPIGELFYIPDYWHPITVWSIPVFRSYISVEDFIFCFAIMGIMSSLPTLILRLPKTNPDYPSRTTITKMVVILGLVAILSLLLWLLGLNSIFATSLAMLIAAALILSRYRQLILLRISVFGAVGMLAMMFVIYWLAFFLVADSDSILRATWTLYDKPLGIRVFRVPLPELVWAVSFGSLFSMLFAKDRVRGLP